MSEPEVSLEQLRIELEKRKADHDQCVAERDAMIEQLKLDHAEVEAAEKLLAAKRKERDDHDQRRRLARQAAMDEYNRIGQLQRLIAQEEDNLKAAQRAAERRQALDELTANAVWRERILPHQLDGAHYLSASQRAVCADGMGLGKTFQIVATLDMLQAMGDGGKKVLIIPPSEVMSVFMKEFQEWAPDRAVVKLGGIGGLAASIETLDFYKKLLPAERTDVINYELIRRAGSKDLVDALILEQYDTIICDEAHVIKETDSAGYKIVEKIVLAHNTCAAEGCGRVTVSTDSKGDVVNCDEGICIIHGITQTKRSAVNFFPMTGTPVLNRPNEIYPLLHLINQQAFPAKRRFEDDYCTKGWDNKIKWKPGGEARLAKQINGSYLRRTRDDAGIKLPFQKITTHDIIFDKAKYPKQAKLLDMLKQHAQIEIEEGRAADMASLLALITRQRQAAVWPGGIWLDLPDSTNPWTAPKVRTNVGALYAESAKMDRAIELADEFEENGERWVLFSQFRTAIDEFAKRRGDSCVVYHGGTDDKTAELIKKNFDRQHIMKTGEAPKWKGVAAHYQKGGTGLTLTAATQTIILDEQWSPGMNQQAYDRTNRLGQTEETGIHILHLEDTIDQWLMSLIAEKRKIVDGFEMELTFQQLADVFAKM